MILARGTENRVSDINEMSLLHHTVYPGWDKETTEAMISLLDDFLKNVPLLRLECTPDVSAVEILNQALENLPL